MIVRRADERGLADHGWLRSRHTFSFADYYDPKHMGFRSLRVINEDRVQAGRGFGTHPHRDMEIITYVLAGELAHKDSMANQGSIKPGEVQRMSAGTGVTHSEFNASSQHEVHFLQIWIQPERSGFPPSYEQIAVPEAERRATLRLVASRDGRDGSVTIHQDANLYASLLAPGEVVTLDLREGRGAWIHVARGSVDLSVVTLAGATLAGAMLAAGDAAAATEPGRLAITGRDAAEILVFDLA